MIINYLNDHHLESIHPRQLSEITGMSARNIQRMFRSKLNTTPRDMLVKARILKACDYLRLTDRPLSSIAVDCGFYDQSSFTRNFKKHIGMTPRKYRAGTDRGGAFHFLRSCRGRGSVRRPRTHARGNGFVSQLYKNENLQANKYPAEYCEMQREEVGSENHEACEVLSSFGSQSTGEEASCMRKILIPAAVLLCSVTLAFAGGNSEKSSTNAAKKGLVIGFAGFFTGNSWNNQCFASIEKAAAQDPEIASLVVANADANVEKQIAQINDMIDKHVDGIVVMAASDTAENPVLEAAVKAGIPVVTSDHYVTSKKLTCQIYVDQFQWGRVTAQWLVDQLGPKGGNIVVLERCRRATLTTTVVGAAQKRYLTSTPRSRSWRRPTRIGTRQRRSPWLQAGWRHIRGSTASGRRAGR